MFTSFDLILLIAGIVTGYVHASLVESWCHDRIWHARKATLKSSARVPVAGASLRRAWQSHTLVHHGMSYRRDHVTQFVSGEEETRANEFFQDKRLALTNKYGLTVSKGGFLRFMLPFMLFNIILAIAAPAMLSVPFALMSLTPALLSTFLHPYMHMPMGLALSTAPWPIRVLLRSKLGPRMWVHHFLHHRHPRVCFNLGLPIGDWLRGVSRTPNATDLAELRKVGGPSL